MDAPHLHPAAMPLDDLWRQCEVQFTRRSGPGGQHRNKVETAVVLLHSPTGTRAEAGERRSQAENRRVALHRLRVRLALQVRSPVCDGHTPSPLWQSRCVGGRLNVAAEHADFPGLLAEALDVLAAGQMDVSQAAQVLSCTASQLVKFLKREPLALAMLNQHRLTRGLRPLA